MRESCERHLQSGSPLHASLQKAVRILQYAEDLTLQWVPRLKIWFETNISKTKFILQWRKNFWLRFYFR